LKRFYQGNLLLPDLNSWKSRIKRRPWNKSARSSFKNYFEENLSGHFYLKSSDAEPKVKQVVLASLEAIFTKPMNKITKFLLKNM